MSSRGGFVFFFFFQDLKAVFPRTRLQLTHSSDQILFTVTSLPKNIQEFFFFFPNSEAALKICLVLMITNRSVNDLF